MTAHAALGRRSRLGVTAHAISTPGARPPSDVTSSQPRRVSDGLTGHRHCRLSKPWRCPHRRGQALATDDQQEHARAQRDIPILVRTQETEPDAGRRGCPQSGRDPFDVRIFGNDRSAHPQRAGTRGAVDRARLRTRDEDVTNGSAAERRDARRLDRVRCAEEPRTRAEYDRMDDKAVLVDQPGLDQRPGEPCPALG